MFIEMLVCMKEKRKGLGEVNLYIEFRLCTLPSSHSQGPKNFTTFYIESMAAGSVLARGASCTALTLRYFLQPSLGSPYIFQVAVAESQRAARAGSVSME